MPRPHPSAEDTGERGVDGSDEHHTGGDTVGYSEASYPAETDLSPTA